MNRNRTYVGLSTSCRRSSVAIVSSTGEIRLLEQLSALLEQGTGASAARALWVSGLKSVFSSAALSDVRRIPSPKIGFREPVG